MLCKRLDQCGLDVVSRAQAFLERLAELIEGFVVFAFQDYQL